jgi:glutamine cyclotransferase
MYRGAMRFLFLPLLALAACGQATVPAAQTQAPVEAAASSPAPIQGYRVVNTFPHDPQAFTQGLFWLDGHLYESTGHIGQSTIRRVELETGRVLQSIHIPPGLFGEGIVNWGDEIVSLTWQDQIGFRWDLRTFERRGEWRYRGEGWGLTQNGRDIIMSDGTDQLRFLDPETLEERRRLNVTDAGAPVMRLNELEWVDGEIYANVWLTAMIARIDPENGEVKGWIDLTPLHAEATSGRTDDVLNGIAWDAERRRLFVTGKNWPRLYEIEVPPPR